MKLTTNDIITLLEKFVPFGENDEEYDNETYFYNITENLTANSDGYLAIDATFKLIEKYPDVDFGSPGPLVHWLESLSGHYESRLYTSIQTKPAQLTVWMLNRIINVEKDILQRTIQINMLADVLKNEHASISTQRLVATLMQKNHYGV